jgi:hypothetical protein
MVLLAAGFVLLLARDSQPAVFAAASSPAVPPAGWKTVMNDGKTCKLSLPPAWVQPDSGGMFGRMEKGEMAMFAEDEETQKAGNWGPVHREIEKKKAKGAKVEILEESPQHIIFQMPQGSVLAVMAFRRSPKTLCVAQIGVPAGDPAQQKVARQIAGSLAPVH